VLPLEPLDPEVPFVPELPPTPEDPLRPEEPEEPEEPKNVPFVPFIPDDPEVPVVPLEPEVPAVPLEPEEPEVPIVPLEPEEPEDPAVPEVPLLPVEPDEPEEPELPLKPEDPEVESLPEVPAVPEDPVCPEVPLVPAVPTPEVPDEPDTPLEPDEPLVPDQPDVLLSQSKRRLSSISSVVRGRPKFCRRVRSLIVGIYASNVILSQREQVLELCYLSPDLLDNVVYLSVRHFIDAAVENVSCKEHFQILYENVDFEIAVIRYLEAVDSSHENSGILSLNALYQPVDFVICGVVKVSERLVFSKRSSLPMQDPHLGLHL
jgi:hypothetical protein